MTKRNSHDLSPGAAAFAAGIAKGLDQSSAYRKAFQCAGVSPQRINERASKLAKKGQVQARVAELLREAKIQDIDSVGTAYNQLLADMESARGDKNHTALAAYSRIRVQVLGMIKDSLHLTVESTMSDEALIKALAGDDDPAMAAKLAAMLGHKDSVEKMH